ncbi:hypothetical protein ACFIQF_12925 [Comamonas sp. J-3]|uniref:hypothetical protein n=1 Tax=Comamonas trifloxystrobinivorans TaxID=3350256 RepID=UPI003726A87B
MSSLDPRDPLASSASNPLVNWDRTGMTNADVAKANPNGRVTMQRQADGTMSFSGGNVSGPVSYADASGKAAPGAGINGQGFSKVLTAPAGNMVATDGNGSFAFSNELVNGRSGAAGQPADTAAAAGQARATAAGSPAPQAGWSGVIGGSALGFDPAARNAEFERNKLMAAIMDKGTKRSQRQALTNMAQIASADANSAARLASEEARATAANETALQATGMRERGEDSRLAARNAIAASVFAVQSAHKETEFDIERKRLQIEASKAGNVGIPSGYRATADGNLAYIAGGPADPNAPKSSTLNDTQSKALMFGTRMQQSGQAMDKLAAGGVSQPGYIKRLADTVGAGALANWTQSPEQQQVEQSQRDFVNAVLRRESGAAISASEFDNARKQYFTQPGDSPQVSEQKRKNRELATRGMLAEVPNQQARVSQVLSAAGAGAQPKERTVTRTGTINGRKVNQYDDGSIDYAN